MFKPLIAALIAATALVPPAAIAQDRHGRGGDRGQRSESSGGQQGQRSWGGQSNDNNGGGWRQQRQVQAAPAPQQQQQRQAPQFRGSNRSEGGRERLRQPSQPQHSEWRSLWASPTSAIAPPRGLRR